MMLALRSLILGLPSVAVASMLGCALDSQPIGELETMGEGSSSETTDSASDGQTSDTTDSAGLGTSETGPILPCDRTEDGGTGFAALSQCGLTLHCGESMPGYASINSGPGEEFMGYNPSDLCLLQAMRDDQPGQLDLIYRDLGEWANNWRRFHVFLPGDGTAIITETEAANGLQRFLEFKPRWFTLRDTTYFVDCLNATDLGNQLACLDVENWQSSCIDEWTGGCP